MHCRGVILTLVSLLLGAITTVAVTWGISAARPCSAEWFGSKPTRSYAIEREHDMLLACEGHACHHRAVLIEKITHWEERERFRDFLMPTGRLHVSIEALPPWARREEVFKSDGFPASPRDFSIGLIVPDRFSYVVNAYGWPSPALRGAKIETTPTGGTWRDPKQDYRDYVLIGQKPIALPLGIIWPGFLINTLTFAAAWLAALLLGERAFRAISTRARFRRALRRGTCPACRYDLLGDFSSGCPECGWNREAADTGSPHSGHTPDTLPERS